MYVSSIAAIAKNNVIGRDNTLIWHIPEDLKHFKKTTMGKPIVMGRKSYDSIGKPLPGRPNIVISRSFKELDREATPHFTVMESVEGGAAKKVSEGPFLYSSIEEGIKAAKDMAEKMGVDEIFITGGGEIYKQTLPITDRLYLTVIDREYEGDTYFPDWEAHAWNTVSKDHRDGDPAFTFFVLERK
ncbi:MAG: dihydrofolate reductase [Alphaproteobacteria bacterium]|nr:dihydrofolate reductase [Alphaproteobacteria bacterium]